MDRIKFMNIEIDNVTMKEALHEINRLVKKRGKAYSVTPNVDHIMKLQTDKEFVEIYKKADLVLCDGKPLVWISRLYGTPIKAKVSGSDLFPRLCAMSAKKGYKMYFLGAGPGVAEKAAAGLRKRYKGLNVVGTYSPSYGFEKKEEEVKEIIGKVRSAQPDILIVALGAPKQEKFVYEHLDELNVPFSIGLGASLDFEAGNIKRAPRWMSNCGLEWLYRIFQDPKRLVKRYLVDDLKIVGVVFKYLPVKNKADI